MEDVKSTETEEQRHARLVAEAKALKVPHDESWTADQLEKVVARKRAVVAAKKEAPPTPPQKDPLEGIEGDDGAMSEAEDEVLRLKEQLRVSHDEQDRLRAKTKSQEDVIFRLESEKSELEVELFNFRAKASGVVDKPEVTEDFGGTPEREPAPASAPRRVRAPEMVECTVTKHGDGQIFTGAPNGEKFKRGAKFPAVRENAESLEQKGFVEID